MADVDENLRKQADRFLQEGNLALAQACMSRCLFDPLPIDVANTSSRKLAYITFYKVLEALKNYKLATTVISAFCSEETAATCNLVFLAERGNLCRDQHDFPKAEWWLRRAVDRAANDSDPSLELSTTLILLGSAVVRQGRHQEAIEIHRQAAACPLEAQPHPDEPWLNIGLAQRALGDFAAAKESLERSRELCRDSDCEETLADVTTAMKMLASPCDFVASHDLADDLLYDGNAAQALICAEQTLQNDPNSMFAIESYVQVLIACRRFAEAETQIERLSEDAVDQANQERAERMNQLISGHRKSRFEKLSVRPTIAELRASLEHTRGHLDEAETWYREAIELTPLDHDQSIGLAHCLVKLQRLDDAYDVLVSATQRTDRCSGVDKVYAELGHIQRCWENYESAAEAYTAAAEILQHNEDNRDQNVMQYLNWRDDAEAAARF